MRARSPRICSEQQGGVGGVLLQHGAASGKTGAHLMTVDAPSTLPLRLADLSGSYNIQMTGASSGVARSGKLLIQSHLVAFRLIPYRLRGAGMRGSRLRGNDGGGVNLGLIWPCLASFTPSGEVGNEANCGHVWPWLRIRGRGWEWPGVAKLLFRFHFLPFGSISHPPNPHPRLLPEGEGTCRGRGSHLRGNDGRHSL